MSTAGTFPAPAPAPAPLRGGRRARRRAGVLPGFGLSLGYTVTYLSLVVIIPLAGLALRPASLTAAELWTTIASPRALAAYRLTLGAALAAGVVNATLGMVVAWTLGRYRFPGKWLLDAMVDLPFALPTAVAGIALTALYAENGWLGHVLVPLGIDVAYARPGVIVAMVFVGLPFVVRTVEPVLLDLEPEIEEAAATLGAGRFTIFWRVIIPTVAPALLTGFALSFARAMGEYGSIVFISGNMPMRTEIVPLLIVTKLEQYDYPGATALALVMLAMSFGMLLIITTLQGRMIRRRTARGV